MARSDYYYHPKAPKPNSIRPATAVALFNSAGDILLFAQEGQRQMDDARWNIGFRGIADGLRYPGGA
jgi:hypothetical protein